jgi:hypothetical protein
MSSTSSPLSGCTDLMLGDILGERALECKELDDCGLSRLDGDCNLYESPDRFLCGLRNMSEVAVGTTGLTGVASRNPMCGSSVSGDRDLGMSK